MKDKKEPTSIKKPKFVLTDAAKFYLAVKEIPNEDHEDLFFIAALFLPVKKSGIYMTPRTEVATFDDADSAEIYRETVSVMTKINANSKIGKAFKKEITKFCQREK